MADHRTSPGLSHAGGDYEPSLSFQVLPRCAFCGAAHPLAQSPLNDPSFCLCCHAPLPPLAPTVKVPAVLTDWRAWLGMALLKIGRGLSRLSKGNP